MVTTAERLQQIMREEKLRQADIIDLAKPLADQYESKLTRQDLSQYCHGKVTPSQQKLFLLAAALNVNEAWLMGYDVPRVRNKELQALTSPEFNPATAAAIKSGSAIAEDLISINMERLMNISNQERDMVFAFREADIMTQRNIYRILGLDEKNLSSESSQAAGGEA